MLNYFNQKIIPIFPLMYLLSILIIFSCTNEQENKQPEITQVKEKVVPKTPKSEYTEKEAGEWEGIKLSHLPTINIKPKLKKDNIEIKVKGEFTEEHYIERIGIMDENKQDIAVANLKKLQKPEVIFSLDPIPENPKIKVYVKCSLHDLWTKPLLPSKDN